MRSTGFVICIALASCQKISGLEEIEIVDSPIGGGPVGAGGHGGSGGQGPLVCEDRYLDRNRIEADGCEFQAEITTDRLVLWLSPDYGITASDGNVSKWLDQSSRRNDFRQQYPASRPTLVEGALNDLAALRFGLDDKDDDGEPDGSSLVSTEYLLANFGAGITFAAVARRDVTGVNDTLIDMVLEGGPNDSKNIYLSQRGNEKNVPQLENDMWFGSTVVPAGWDNNVVISSDKLYTPNTPHLITVVVGPDEYLRFRYDGEDSAVVDAPIPIMPETSQLSSVVGANIDGGNDTRFHHGLIAEIVMYERALDDREIAVVEEYLQDKWGL